MNLKGQMPFSASLYDIIGLANLCIFSSTSEGVATTVNGLLTIPACFWSSSWAWIIGWHCNKFEIMLYTIIR